MLAGQGPMMTRVAAEGADGLLVHGFTTARYLREVTMPIIEAGLVASAAVGPFHHQLPRADRHRDVGGRI